MPRHRYEEDAPISDALAQSIGHMVQQWGHLEDNASVLTALLLNANDYDFRAVARNMGTTAKFDALAAAARQTMTPRRARTIAKVAEAAKALAGERNRIVHGSWYPTRNPNVAERFTYEARGRLSQRYEQVSAARVRGFTERVIELRRWLNHALSRQGFYRMLRAEQRSVPPLPSP